MREAKMGVQGCCGCMNLRDGSIAIGITLLTLSSLSVMYQVGSFIYMGVSDSWTGPPAWAIALNIAIAIVHVVFNALLVHGARKTCRGMVLAWIIYQGIVAGLGSAAAVILFIYSCATGIVVLIIIALAFCGLMAAFWYWFVVVLSFYYEMQEHTGTVYMQTTDSMEKQTQRPMY